MTRYDEIFFQACTVKSAFELQELELLPAKELHHNVYIRHPVSIEQYLMEGSYNKVTDRSGSRQCGG